jgi:hypothetical protein
MSAMLRSIAALAILVLAFLAVLVVFDVIPRDVLGDYAAKVVLVACILALTSAAMALLMRTGGR